MLEQLRGDHRTVALLMVVPCVLMALLYWVFDGAAGHVRPRRPRCSWRVPVRDDVPRHERRDAAGAHSGTLERLLTTPLAKLDLLLGYALAFGVAALIQATLASALALGPLGLDPAGSIALVLLLAVANAVLGMALGLLVSAFAQSEFQAVQFMPAFVLPQLLLCGLIAPRDQMAGALEAISAVLPMTYAVDGMSELAHTSELSGDLLVDLLVVAGSAAAALALGAGTLRRRTA